MTAGEASRQYQLAIEHRRSMRAAVDGCVSFDDELASLDEDVSAAERQVIDVLVADGAARL